MSEVVCRNDLFGRVSYTVNYERQHPRHPLLSVMATRSWIIGALAVLTLLGIAVFVETERLEVHRHDLRADLTRPSLRVVQLSDLHLHAMDAHEQAVVQQVKALQPDLLVLKGDMVDRADALPVLEAFLAALGSVRTVAVPGNWEHWNDAFFEVLRKLFESRPDGQFLRLTLLLSGQWSVTATAQDLPLDRKLLLKASAAN